MVGERVQAPLEVVAADILEQLPERVVGGPLLGAQRGDEAKDRRSLGAAAGGGVALEPLDLHVEVPALPERVGEPLDLGQRAPEGRAGKARLEDLERGAQAAGGDARVVERLDVIQGEHLVLAREHLFGAHGDRLGRHRGIRVTR